MLGILLGFGGGEEGEGEDGKGQGRLAMEVGVWRRVSMVGECAEREKTRVPVFESYVVRTKDWVARGCIRGGLMEWGIGGWLARIPHCVPLSMALSGVK